MINKGQQVQHLVVTVRAADFTVDLTWTPKDKHLKLIVALENGATIKSVDGGDGSKGVHLLLTNLAAGRYVVTIVNTSDQPITTTCTVTHG